MTLNDLEHRNSLYFAFFFTVFDRFSFRLYISGWRYAYNVCKILSPSSSLLLLVKTITHPAARSLCDIWASCSTTLWFHHPTEGFLWDDLRKILPGRIKWRRNIAAIFNRLSRVHERYRQTNDRQTDGWTTTYSEHEHFVVRARCHRIESLRSLSHLLMSFLSANVNGNKCSP